MAFVNFLMMGDNGSGKTSLWERYFDDYFNEGHPGHRLTGLGPRNCFSHLSGIDGRTYNVSVCGLCSIHRIYAFF